MKRILCRRFSQWVLGLFNRQALPLEEDVVVLKTYKSYVTKLLPDYLREVDIRDMLAEEIAKTITQAIRNEMKLTKIREDTTSYIKFNEWCAEIDILIKGKRK